MADTIGLYYKTGGVESGGTNALTGLLTGGTLISSADAETSPFAFPALDTVYTLYYRAIDSVTLDDAGKDTTAAFTITAPTGVQVCSTWNGTFASSAEVPAAVGAYKPVYAKQTAHQTSAEADLEVGTGGVTFASGTRLSAPVITLTPGGGSITIDAFSAVTDATGYQYRYKLTAGSYGAWASITTSGTTISGLTNGSEYTVQVRAWSELGAGTADTEVATTPYTFSDDFSSLDTNRWGTDVEGNGTVGVTAGELVLNSSGATTDAAIAYIKNSIPAAAITYRVKSTVDSGVDGTAYDILSVSNTTPFAGVSTDVNPARLIQVARGDNPATNGFVTIFYYDTGGVAQRWNGSSWVTSAGTNAATSATAFDYGVYTFVELECSVTQFRVNVYGADGTTQLAQTAWVNWTSLRSHTSKYVWFGDPHNNAWNMQMSVDSCVVS